jgi:thioredoxin 1
MKKLSVIVIGLMIIGTGVIAQEKQNAPKVPMVTFIELGSVNCIPCKMMQPVMKKVEAKYGSQVKVIFYDVWTDKGAPYGESYKIRAIPTQVFLDANGKEYSRHEGYFPFEELEKVLRQKGVK